MKNRYQRIPLVVVLLLLAGLLLSPAASAQKSPRYVDRLGLLRPEEARTITKLLDEISRKHSFDVVIAVVSSIGYREAHHYAADFFEQNGFGYGPDLDGIILLLSMDDRDWGFATLGRGLEVFTYAGQEYLEKHFLPDLKEERFLAGFQAFANAADDFLQKAQEGKAYDQGNIPLLASERNQYYKTAVAASLIIAFLIALVTTLIWRGQLTSRREDRFAHQYIRQGSMVLASQRDIFLHRNVRRVKKESSSSGSSKGGSFKTSSGRSSSGRSGKF